MSLLIINSQRKIVATAVVFAVTGLASIQSFAAGAGNWLEEIVVTAQKREESAQDIPIAINAMSGEQLDTLQVQDTDDIVKLFANLSVQNPSAINSGLTIRGVGTFNFHITAAQSVGQYVDEVSLTGPYTSQLAVFDMERIEVLRGPQNTLFGRNTTGGAVNYISRKPVIGEDAEGYLQTSIGSEGRLDAEGAISVPLSDVVAMRISVQSVTRDGIWENLFNGSKMGDIDRKSARVQFLVAPSEATEILVNAHAGYSDSGRRPYLSVGFWDPNGSNVSNGAIVDLTAVPDCPSVLAGGSAQFDGVSNCVTLDPRTGDSAVVAGAGDWHKTYDAAPDVAEVDTAGIFLKITHDFEFLSLVSLTSFDNNTVEYVETLANIPSGNAFMPGQSGDTDIFSQELRLSSSDEGEFRWILGAYYSREAADLATIIYRFDQGGAPFGIVPSVTIDQEVDILSGYGKFDWDLSDKLKMSLGLRYTSDKKEGTSLARVFAKTDTGLPPPSTTPAGTPLGLGTYLDLDRINQFPNHLRSVNTPVKQDLGEVGGRVSVSYFVSDDAMLYTSYSRGFKSGAFDTRALAALQPNATADKPTNPEFLDAYEIGFKSNLANGSLEFNGALFYYQWEDLQAFDVDLMGSVAFLNVPESELLGAELEVKWAPTDNLYIQTGLGWLDTEVTDPGTLVTVAKGASLSNSPEFTLSGLIVQSVNIGDRVLSLQTDFRWTDEKNTGKENNLKNQIDSSFVINARATMAFGEDEQFEASVWADNITGEKTCLNIGDNGALNYTLQCMPNDGMAFYGVNLRYNF